MSNPAPNPGRPPSAPFLTRVRVRNFKSLVDCDVELGSLNVLVGRNGAGKSNFLDALRFVGDALRSSLTDAVSSRGGLDLGSVWNRRAADGSAALHPLFFEIKLALEIGYGKRALYALQLERYLPEPLSIPWSGRRHGYNYGFVVAQEDLEISGADGALIDSYRIRDGGLVDQPDRVMPPVSPGRLYLANAAGLPQFREVYDALLMTRFYDLSPSSMKKVRPRGAGESLRPNGENLASVIGSLETERPGVLDRINHYLASMVPGVMSVERIEFGPMETLAFGMMVGGSTVPLEFYADSMSDGTLRALGALVAVNQLAEGSVPVRLVGIEEPEAALHPAASGVLMDALREAAVHTQVVVTTHSPDLLDQIDPETDRLLVVQARGGDTEIGPIDPASREAVRDHLYSPGELLRMDQLEPDRSGLRPGLKASGLSGESG